MTHRPRWPSFAAIAAAVFGAALLSYALSLRGIVCLWLPSGLALGLLLLLDRTRWASVLAAAWVGNIAADLIWVRQPALALLAPPVNVAEALLAASVVRALTAGRNPVVSLRGAGALIAGVVGSNALTAVAGGGLLAAISGRAFGGEWLSWWIGDSLGMLVVTPAMLGLRDWIHPPARGEKPPARRLEAAGMALLLAITVVLTFDHPGALNPAAAAAVFPLLILGAVRLGGAAHALVPVLAILALSFSTAGRGPLVQPGMRSLELAVHVLAFLGIAAVSMLVLAAAMAERAAAEEQRERLQRRLHEAERLEAIGRLTGGIAHDFNNVLTVVVSHVAFARDELPAGHPVQQHLREIHAAAQRSTDLTRQLLGFGRRQTVAPRDVDLDAAICGMLGMLRRLVGEDLTLEFDPGAPGRVHIDPSQLDQILVNLCANARDATRGPGRIVLQTAHRELGAEDLAQHPDCTAGRYAVLSVRDQGSGMDSETLAHAFEPFFTTKPADKGTGLGLASVWGIVKQNGGFVEIDSAPGVGTAVRIGLSCSDAAPHPQPAAAGAAAPAHDTAATPPGETVLLVEDDHAVLKLAATELTRLGYRVLPASTPEQAIATARAPANDIGLLVTDVVMPRMNGRELAARITALHARTRVLFTSGYPADVIATNGELERDIEFLAKPYAPSDLASKVRAVLDAAP